ncbi:MAG: sensor histidine kinase KdpD [Chitinivibrionales bacterium]|nr:sensor histidine kinase KdpD [Chitinivibrionales bacterium]
MNSEPSKERGRLKIFFGMSAGVGKTYAMLQAAQSLKTRGINVMVGLVETHGRKETEALLAGLTIIPRVDILYRTLRIPEMDLDTILRLRPAYVLVDELAHTNTEGMRHKKRYQDVVEILDNGINVYTTLNVQHVESLVDTVAAISGITVQETVPDSIIDAADEIELIDLPPEELLQRLKEGKVYASAHSAAALENFFKKGNLYALREISLRKTAQRVDLQLKDFMQEKGIKGPWKAVERLMVAVGPSPYSERLIRWTRRIAATMKAPWVAVYVQTNQTLTVDAEKRLKKNIALAVELGATLVTTTDEDIVKALLRTAQQQNVTQIVIGKSMTGPLIDLVHGGSLVNRLIRESGAIDIYVVQSESASPKRSGAPALTRPRRHSPWHQYALSCGAVMAAAGFCFFASALIDYRSIGMILLFVISALALFVGGGPVLMAAIVSALVWDFFFIPPFYTFSIQHPADILLVLLYFAVALLAGSLTTRLRRHETTVRRREAQTQALFRLGSELSSAESLDDIVNVAVTHIAAHFQCSVVIYPAELAADINAQPHSSSSFKPDSLKEWSVAEWVYKNKKPAGHGTATLPFAQGIYFPLLMHGSCYGVIGCASVSGGDFSFEKEGLLQMFIQQITLALERLHLRSERLNKTLLNSISHEFRTPLTTITGAAGGLLDPKASTDPHVREVFITDINTAALRLNRLVGNLLDITRVESGSIKISEQWCDIADLISTVVQKLHNELAGRTVKTTIPPDMPFVKIDTVLLEQALINIVLNATQYTPAGAAIFLSARYDSPDLVLTIEDEGPGFSPESRERIFDKFYRVPGTQPGGTGLGLSIVKGIVEFHGGTVGVRNRPAGGAQFTVRLPVPQKMPSLTEREPDTRKTGKTPPMDVEEYQ